MPDDHPGLAAEYDRAQHPSKWTIAHFDWFSDEYTVLGLGDSEADAKQKLPELARQARCKESNLVVLAPRARTRRKKPAADSA